MLQEQRSESNGQTGLIILLLVMIGFAVYQFFIVPMLNKEEEPSNSNVPVETEAERIERIANSLYDVYSLTVEEEYVLTAEDKTYLNDSLTLYKMSDATKIYLGIKNIDEKYITKDDGYRVKEAIANANGNYYYGGTYIMQKFLDESIQELFGEISVQHQTITLPNVRYVYNADKEIYEIWNVRVKTEIEKEKITYKEVVNNNNELYIYEYVAYTDFTNPENLVTSTVHNVAIEAIITEDNVSDCLNYMDKYRYVFQKVDDEHYLFQSIDYLEE